MIKPIVTDTELLCQKSENFIPGEDDHIITDMLDTANAHDNCVGLAAVQIGHLKRVILVQIKNRFVPFINPVIMKKTGKPYTTTEGCLSLDGCRTTTRYPNVLVSYTDMSGKRVVKTYTGWTAQIIQHEVDHLNGILI